MGAGARQTDLTALPVEWRAGGTEGRDRLVEAVQGELRRIAAAHVRAVLPLHALRDSRQAEIVEPRYSWLRRRMQAP